jgi:hypothetical protein
MMIMLGEIGRGRVEHQSDTHTLTIHSHNTLPSTQNLPDNSTQHNVIYISFFFVDNSTQHNVIYITPHNTM